MVATALLGALSASGATWYAAANGSSTQGTYASPWSVEYAVGKVANPQLRPGDTVIFKTGGTYVCREMSTGYSVGNVLEFRIGGTATQKITYRSETLWGFSFDGGLLFPYEASNVVVHGFRIFWSGSADRVRTDPYTHPPGISCYGQGVEVMHNLIENSGHPGIGSWKFTRGKYIAGNVIRFTGFNDHTGSYNGANRGSGMYLQNQLDSEEALIEGNISYYNYTTGMKAYGNTDMYKFRFTRNICIENHEAGIFYHVDDYPADGVQVINNFIWNGRPGIRVGYPLGQGNHQNAVINDNYVVDEIAPLYLADGWHRVTATGNRAVNHHGSKIWFLEEYGETAGSITSHTFNNNAYFGATNRDANRTGNFEIKETLMDFASWKTQTTEDANSTFTLGLPTTVDVNAFRPSTDPNFVHVAVFNWAGAREATVNLGSYFTAGDTLRIYDAQAIPNAYTNFTYTGGSVKLDLSRTAFTPMLGRFPDYDDTWGGFDPRVRAFVIHKYQAAAGGNTPPTISGLPNTTINVNSATAALPFTIGDSQSAASALAVSFGSSNPTLVPVSRIALGGSGANRTVTVTPAANQSGTATITVTVSDGSLTTSTSFILTVTPPNTRPTISPVNNASIPVNGSTGPLTFTVGDGQTAAGSLNVTRASSNTSLVPLANVVLGGSGANRTVTVTPAANQSGITTITLTVSDGSLTASTSFDVSVAAANTAPTISNPGNITIAVNSSTGARAFTVGDAQTSPGSLTLTRTSSNTTLVPVANIVLGGSGANRTVTVTPAANQSGSATIGLVVSDGTLTASTSFVVTVTPANTAPTISALSNITLASGQSSGARSFTVGDAQTAAGSLVVSRTSSNTTLIPVANIVLGGSGANRTVTVTPAAGRSGTATIGLVVSDGTLTASTSFVVTVTAPNTAPTISTLPDITLAYSQSSGARSFTVGDAQTAAGSLVVSRASSNTTLIPVANIVLGGSGANRTVTVMPAAGQSGTATITLTVSDGSLSATSRFVVTVNPANTAPVISNIADVTIDVNSATAPIPFWISDYQTSSTALVVTAKSSNTNLVPVNSIAFAGTGANRTVQVTPLAGRFGSPIITLTVSDGSLTSSTDFEVKVVLPSGNTPPTITAIPDTQVAAGATTPRLNFSVNDAEISNSRLRVSATTSNSNLDVLILLGGTNSGRYLRLTPASNQSGTTTVTVTVSDGTLEASTSFRLTVTGNNTPPTLSAIANATIDAGSSTAALPFVVGDAETSAANLTLSYTTSNSTLVPSGAVVFGGSGANRTVRVTPSPTRFGTATITVTVSDGSLTASRNFTLTVKERGLYYFLAEAESATLAVPLRTYTDPLASGGLYVASPAADSGTVTLAIDVPAAGQYVIWGRVKAPQWNADSFYVSVDNGPVDTYDTAESIWSPAWQWTMVNGRGNGQPGSVSPRVFTLQAGVRVITFRTREANSTLDAILITNDLDFVPSDSP